MRFGRHAPWIALAGLVVLAVGERWALPAWRARHAATREAQWVSAPISLPVEEGNWHQPVPVSDTGFFALRDFTVEEGFERALLRVTGDEAFWVNLNEIAVAAGRFHPDAPLAVVDVTQFLRPGANRLLVELRSARPTGGLLLSLEIEGPRPLRLVTDGQWRVTREYPEEGGVAGTEVAGAQAARAWGIPPTGRWGSPSAERLQPALVDLLLPGQTVAARRARVGDPAGPWFRLPNRADTADPLGHWVTFDFGRPQNGYLSFFFRQRGPATGLVYLGITPPDPRTERPAVVLLKLPGLATWTQAVPRRFRYVTIVSPNRVSGAKVYRVDPLRARRLLAPAPAESAALGLPMPLRTAVEDEIWRQVESLASGRAREGS